MPVDVADLMAVRRKTVNPRQGIETFEAAARSSADIFSFCVGRQ